MSEWKPLMHTTSMVDLPSVNKMQEAYWTTKHIVLKKLGIKEDEHLIASDAKLDARLELFHFVQNSCLELLKVINHYQNAICVSSYENAIGRLLKTESYRDKSCAGRVMEAVGKSQTYASQQILHVRVPLTHVYQEVTTFLYRAVDDTLLTVEQMEAARAEYRGALLWMRDVSENLDPDAEKRLHKFRMVQAQVKRTKARFDQLKVDTMQKVDLLAASQCNMYSHVLGKYQTTFLLAFERIARRLTAVADSIRACQYYAFTAVVDIGEPGKKASEETANLKLPDYDVTEATNFQCGITGVPLPDVPPIPKAAGTLLFHCEKDSLNCRKHIRRRSKETSEDAAKQEQTSTTLGSSHEKSTTAVPAIRHHHPRQQQQQQQHEEEYVTVSFIDFDDDDCDALATERSKPSQQRYLSAVLMKNLPSDTTLDQVHTLHQDLSWLSLETPSSSGELGGQISATAQLDHRHIDSDDDSRPLPRTDAAADSQHQNSLQDTGPRTAASLLLETAPLQPVSSYSHHSAKSEHKSDVSSWFSVFAELDPLSNPDAFGRSKDSSVQA